MIWLAAHKADRQTFGTETAGTTYTVEIAVSITWQVVVDGQVDTFDINTTTENVSRNTDTLVEFLELLVTVDTIEED